MTLIKLTQRRKEALVDYLSTYISQIEDQLDKRRERWRQFTARYEARSIQKSYPRIGASSIHVPLVAIALDSIKSRITNALFAQQRIINVEPLSEDVIDPSIVDPQTGEPLTWRHIADLAERYFNFEISPAGDVDFHRFIEEWLDEILLFGTGIAKVVWDNTVIRERVSPSQFVDTLGYSNVRLLVPSLEDVYIPPHYDSLERIPFIMQRFRMRPSEMLQRQDWDQNEVRRFLREHGTANAQVGDLERAASEIEETYEPDFLRGELWMAESWIRFPLSGGKEERLLVHHSFDHPEYIFSVQPWPYSHGQLPFHVARYIRRRKRMYGMGIAERLESLDEGLSTAVNAMIDNITAANTRLWSVASGSPAESALQTIWPNKVIPRRDPTDVEPLQLGEVYPSAFELQNVIRDYAERTIKLTDYNLGRESQALGRQSTATATLALLQESGQHFDTITRDIRRALSDIVQQWFDLLVQHRPLERVARILGPSARPFLAALTLPHGDLRTRLAVRPSFTSIASTRELARQEELTKNQVLRQYGSDLLALAQLRFSPETPAGLAALIDEIANSYEFHIRKLLETYGESVSNMNLPSWRRTINAEGSTNLGPGAEAQSQQAALESALGAAQNAGLGGPNQQPPGPAGPAPNRPPQINPGGGAGEGV